MNKKHSKYVKLCKDASFIPKGIYKYLGIENGCHVFTIKNKVIFGFAVELPVEIKRLPTPVGLRQRTSFADFSSAYMDLFERLKDEGNEHTDYISFCDFSPIGNFDSSLFLSKTEQIFCDILI